MLSAAVMVLSMVLLSAGTAFARDIPRDGKITVPDKQQAIEICRKNPYINTNMLLAGCAQMEQQSAQRVLSMIS